MNCLTARLHLLDHIGVLVADAIRKKLDAALSPVELVVQDESAQHAGHSGARPEGETHFHVRIVSPLFSGMTRVARQRRVYEVLADEMAGRVHALSLETFTPDEAKK